MEDGVGKHTKDIGDEGKEYAGNIKKIAFVCNETALLDTAGVSEVQGGVLVGVAPDTTKVDIIQCTGTSFAPLTKKGYVGLSNCKDSH
ncbi:hypothetical protein NQ315_002792 [Exocentrus adspersus]|uniref:Uncharacterized protein n=1 Tax=Exocentrus adspersus TaxID=1586481 RepID=A0AAV8VK31_9CUCU|nr:hypothetical protein NQ315_002792 [Exocentrus adspersus]